MPIFYNSSGKEVRFTTELGKGGEGSVYSVAGDNSLVGKIYHKPISGDKAEKLRWMAANKNAQLLKIAAWVTDVLYDKPKGKIVGFLMPAVRAKEVHELYSPKSRRTHFPDADWTFLIKASTNLARAFNIVHEQGHVIGDVNHGNCVVQSDSTIKLIDCDSYNIEANGKIYPCEVGVNTHIPPELQGKSLRGISRSQQHDDFGLAVIIFQLLFLGRHPFAGKPLGKEEKGLDDCIREHRFAYGVGSASRQIKPPPGSLPLEAVSPSVAKLFERAFLTRDNRPKPREWIETLTDLSKNLVQCNQYAGHHYFKQLNDCPWCDLETQTGVSVFPKNYQQQGAASGFNIVTIEQLLNSIQIPRNLPAKPKKAALTLPPDPALVKQNRRNGIFIVTFLVVQFAALIFLLVFAGKVGALVCGLTMAFVFYKLKNRVDPQVKKAVLDKLSAEQVKWANLERDWSNRESTTKIIDEASQIRKKLESYKNLSQLRVQKLYELEKQSRERQLNDYLDKYRIDEAHISGIGWNRELTLQSYGIETAADVDSYRILNIPGFGPTYTQKLLNWRAGIEARFRFDPRKGVSEFDKRQVEQQINSTRIQLENALLNGVTKLRTKTENINKRDAKLEAKAVDLSRALAQAQSDRSAIKEFPKSIVVSFCLAVGLPLSLQLGEQIQLEREQRANMVASSSPSPTPMYSPNNTFSNLNSNIVSNANSNLIANANSNVNQNAFSELDLTGIEIDSLTYTERREKAQYFFNKGAEFTKANKYSLAEKYYRVALKLDDANGSYYHELGYALYRQNKFQEAAVNFQKVLNMSSSPGEDTKQLLAESYLGSKKWKEAQKILEELARADYFSFKAHYNLGVAARNNGDLTVAKTALSRAVDIKPDDAKAHFELGRCYIALEQLNEVETQYQTLLNLNPKLAEQLKNEFREN